MLSIFTVFFREMLEITIIMGLILVATKHIKNRHLALTIGISIGVAGSATIALAVSYFHSNMNESLQDYFKITMLSTITIFILATILMMNTHSKKISNKFKNLPNETPLFSLMFITAATILREGFEIILFSYGLIKGHEVSTSSFAIAASIGSISAISIGIAIYYGMFQFGKKLAFKITTILLSLIAASMAVQLLDALQAIDLFYDLSPVLWNSSSTLNPQSILGITIDAFLGYNPTPTLLQFSVYNGILLFIWLMLHRKKA